MQRGCDLVRLKVKRLVSSERIHERVTIVQSITGQPVQFELIENTRDSMTIWTSTPEMVRTEFMFPSRFHDRPHISTRQYGRLTFSGCNTEDRVSEFQPPDSTRCQHA